MRQLIPAVPFVLLFAYGPPAAAQEEDEAVIELSEEDFEILDDEDIEIEDEAADDDAPTMTTGQWLGRLHPPLTHFAVAWAVLLLPLAIARMRREQLGKLDLWLTAGATLAAIVASVTGLLHAPEVMSRPDIHDLVELHEHSALILTGILITATIMRLVLEIKPSKALRVTTLILLGAVLVLVLWVGHLGGNITFGEGYLF